MPSKAFSDYHWRNPASTSWRAHTAHSKCSVNSESPGEQAHIREAGISGWRFPFLNIYLFDVKIPCDSSGCRFNKH